jgi:hypothetical protein
MTETTKKPTTRKKTTSASASAPTSIASKRKAAPKAALVTKSVSHDEIANLAHRFWNERGRQHGHDAEDWLRAEQALLGKAS